MTERPTIAFAGGGHAHLYSLRRTGELVRDGYDVVLVNPSGHLYYSGMATGVISRTHAPEDDRIDLRRLVERGGGRFVAGRVERVLPSERTLLLEDGKLLPYDAVSFCIGSGVAGPGAVHPGDDAVLPVKPVENTARMLERLSGFGGVAGEGPRVLVVGGGAAGCEVAANAVRLMEDLGLGGRVTLAEAGPDLLGGAPPRARRLVHEYLRGRGVEVLLGCAIRSYEDGGVAADGRRIWADLIVPATGVEPPGVFGRSRLLTGPDGGLWVDHHLQSPSDGRIFGGGDSVSFRGRGLPKVGVFAIRQGPLLYRNLRAVLEGDPLGVFRPQRRYLYVLELGDGTGLAVYGPLAYRGRLAAALKHRIDQRFMAKYA